MNGKIKDFKVIENAQKMSIFSNLIETCQYDSVLKGRPDNQKLNNGG